MVDDDYLNDNYDRDKCYWNQYYKQRMFEKDLLLPSTFALFILPYLKQGNRLVDLGCGNGRDSVFFLTRGLNVTGIDASDYSIDVLRNRFEGNEEVTFICGDFVNSQEIYTQKYDYAYSRFSMHAINEYQESLLLRNIYNSLYENGLFFIEARTVNDELFGRGKQVNDNAFIFDNHYRRFINPEAFIKKMETVHFKDIYVTESNNLSVTDTSNPTLMRCIAKK